MRQFHLHAWCLGAMLFLSSMPSASSAQIWKKIKDAAQNIKDAAQGIKEASQSVSDAKQQVTSTAKSLRETWKKDTSANIKYQQVPDYRNRDEVIISKRQKLAMENGEFKNVSWQPVAKFDNQLFPSFIIGWANYTGEKDEDMGSSLGFKITPAVQGVVLRWEIECGDKSFFSIDSGYINCDNVVNNHFFMPKIDWDYRALTKHQSNTPVNVYFRLIDPNTGNKVQKTLSVNLRSINDCLLEYSGTKYFYMFASYVNEDHPAIDGLLKSMLDTKIIGDIVGYQRGPDYVDIQVAALWRVLHDRGFRYSSITDNSGNSSGSSVFSQTVRTFDNSLQTNQANCVDGTVFMASILKKIGIKPILVVIPGHCFLGYYSENTPSAPVHYLETTMMSNDNYLSKDSVKKYNTLVTKSLPKDSKLTDVNKGYYLQFILARQQGDRNNVNNSQAYNKINTTYIDVADARRYIKPIPVFE